VDKTWGFQMAQAIVDRGKKEKGAGMTQDIIDMVKQAGWKDLRDFDSEMNEEIFMGRFADLEYFAKLVAAKERKATIKIIRETPFSNWFQADVIEAIRARGEQA
jgi:hypothetical protein